MFTVWFFLHSDWLALFAVEEIRVQYLSTVWGMKIFWQPIIFFSGEGSSNFLIYLLHFLHLLQMNVIIAINTLLILYVTQCGQLLTTI